MFWVSVSSHWTTCSSGMLKAFMTIKTQTDLSAIMMITFLNFGPTGKKEMTFQLQSLR